MSTAEVAEGAGGGTPFYIVTSRYSRVSAGSRVLHQLAAELEAAGYEAFVVWTGASGVDEVEALRFRHLTEALSVEHFKTGRTPVCIRPEVLASPAPVGLDVVYVLNVPGLLGGPAEVSADLVLAYSEHLARGLPRCDAVVHLPACDPGFWTADPTRDRAGACVYAGKYVEQHGQALPAELAGARVIATSGPRPPTPEQIREVLRGSTHCYVFENTSLVTEALLCGCPVVVRPNPFFSGMIAAEEHGPFGLTERDDPASLAAARAELPRFRAMYLAGFERARRQVRAFASEASALARARRASGAYPVRRVVQLRPPRAGERSLSDPAEPLDVAFLYNLLLGREVEDRAVLAAAGGRPLGAVLTDIARSPEYAGLAARFISGHGRGPAPTVARSLEHLKLWAERRLPLLRRTRQLLRAATNWAAVHATLIADEALAERFGRSSPALADRLLDFSRRPDIRGHVDELGPGAVSGWALDLNAQGEPVRVEVSSRGRVLLETVTGASRPDVAGLVGGDGRAGFIARTSLIEGDLRDVVVRVGAEGVVLPFPTPA